MKLYVIILSYLIGMCFFNVCFRFFFNDILNREKKEIIFVFIWKLLLKINRFIKLYIDINFI